MKSFGRQVRRLQKALKSLKMIGDFRNFRKILRIPKPRRLFINFSKKFWKSSTFFGILGKLHFPLPGTHQTCSQSTTQKKRDGEVLKFPRPVDIFESEHGAHGGCIPPDSTVWIKVMKYQALLGNQQIN